MIPNRFRVFTIAAVILATMMACSMPTLLPASPTKTPTPPPTDTTAPSPIPTDTPTPANTATETLTPEPSTTPTKVLPTAKVLSETNCRIGPGPMYDLVVTFKANAMVNVLAADLGGGYWFVQDATQPDKSCWILGTHLTISGDTSSLPQFTPPPTPTSAPNFNVTFKNFDKCKGDPFARFIVQNTGSSSFRSAYVRVTDLKSGAVEENSMNAFDLTVGCIVAQNIAPLGVGASGYVQSDQFNKDPGGDKLRAVVMLCTDKDLKGACVTKSVDFSK